MVKVSVIVPIYKVERFITKCVDSLMSQTLKDVEFIFVDDASPDRSIELLNKCIRKYPNRVDSIKIVLMRRTRACPLPVTQGWH